jgi:2,4-dienoyl-CoA reductase-like NADH-dependent reductase (Old Yellow Enzyme family)
MTQFPLLFEPITIRGMELRNRIIVPPHGNSLADDQHLPTERQAYYFAEKAKGGAAAIVWGGATIHETSTNATPGRNHIFDERAIPGYRFATDLVHSHGAKMIAQLSHQGRQQTSGVGRMSNWAPSAIPDPVSREIPKEMEPEDFEVLLEAYRHSARIAMEGGFDGVEVYAAQGYLLTQFLMPLANQRTDRYGGSFENRLRFPIEVLQAVRSAVGSDVPMGLRMNGDDFSEGSLTSADYVKIAPRLVTEGDVDYLSISGSTYNNFPIWIGEMTVPEQVFVPGAAAIKQVVDVPVVAVNRIVGPAQAEEILSNGYADLVAINRPIIADPFWPEKARTGRSNEIRSCTYSNQGCVARSFKGMVIGCVHNPIIGFEKQWGEGTLLPAETSRRVVVVGGGPGGMEAARVARLRGHAVTLIDQNSVLGGQIRYLTEVPSRFGFQEIVLSFERTFDRIGVEVRLGQEVTLETLRALSPDIVVIATGSEGKREGWSPARPGRATLPGADLPWVLSQEDVFELGHISPGRVLVYDEEGNANGPVVAEYLLNDGHAVTMVTRFPTLGLGPEYDTTNLTPQLKRLFNHDSASFELHPFLLLDELRADGSALCTHIHSNAVHQFEGMDAAVLVMGNRSRDELYHQAKEDQVADTVVRVGDCVSPRRITDAVFDAHRIVREL